MTLTVTPIRGDADRLHHAAIQLGGLANEIDVVSVETDAASDASWVGIAAESFRDALGDGVLLLLRITDASHAVAAALRSLADDMEIEQIEIDRLAVSVPPRPAAPANPGPYAPTDVVEGYGLAVYIHQQEMDAWRDQIANLQRRHDACHERMAISRVLSANRVHQATAHMLGPGGGPAWSFDRLAQIRTRNHAALVCSNADAWQAIGECAPAVIDHAGTLVGSEILRAARDLIPGMFEGAAAIMATAGNAVWDAFESIGSGFGTNPTRTDPDPHFDVPDFTIGPSHPLNMASNTAYVSAGLVADGLTLRPATLLLRPRLTQSPDGMFGAQARLLKVRRATESTRSPIEVWQTTTDGGVRAAQRFMYEQTGARARLVDAPVSVQDDTGVRFTLRASSHDIVTVEIRDDVNMTWEKLRFLDRHHALD